MAKDTGELSSILNSTHLSDIDNYMKENEESLLSEDRPFSDYMHKLIKEKCIRQQDIFVNADITERYGYKLLSEQKRTRQRDVILRILYGAGFTLAESQKALKIYGMPELYPKIKRDAVLMICFNERPGSIIEVNNILRSQDLEPLRTSGSQE